LIKYPVAAGSRRPSGHRAGLRCRHRSDESQHNPSATFTVVVAVSGVRE
jgi:hypothetical protein